ncbi:MAG: zf-HC2 domain-containing protein, partial [Planctomycetota bacterium]
MDACENTQAELSAYLDGELQDSVRTACEAHVGECAACRAVLADLKAASAAVTGLPKLKAPPALAVHVRQEMLAQPAPRDFSKLLDTSTPAPNVVSDISLWRPVLFGIAALLLVCVLAFVMRITGPQTHIATSTGGFRPKNFVAPTQPASPKLAKNDGEFGRAKSKFGAPPEEARENPAPAKQVVLEPFTAAEGADRKLTAGAARDEAAARPGAA